MQFLRNGHKAISGQPVKPAAIATYPKCSAGILGHGQDGVVHQTVLACVSFETAVRPLQIQPVRRCNQVRPWRSSITARTILLSGLGVHQWHGWLHCDSD